MSTIADKFSGRAKQAACVPCPGCSTPTVVGKHCAECGQVAVAPVPSQRETVIDLTAPGQETATTVLPLVDHSDHGPLHQVDPRESPSAHGPDLLDHLGGDASSVNAPQRRRLPSRRVSILAGIVAVALAALLVGVVALTNHLGGGATREALSVSTREFNAVLSALTAATTVEDVSAAAKATPEAAERIDAQLRLLSAPGDAQERAVADQLDAEKQTLLALSPLTDLSKNPMQTWSSVHEPITRALERESATRAVLSGHHPERAAELPDTAAMMVAVTAAVGAALADTAFEDAGDLLTSLGAATTTTQIRDVAGRASAEQAGVDAVLPALTEQAGRPTLTAYSKALAALAGLASLDGENTAAWTPARAELTAALGQLAGAGAEGAALGSQATTTLAAVDAIITKAAGQIADWKAAHEAAIADRNADSEAMTAYADTVRAEIKGYELLRNDLQAFFDRVEDPNVTVYYYEAYSELYEAEESRREVRDRLTAMSVPEGMRHKHSALVAVLTRAIAAVQAGYDGVSQADSCYDYCYYRDAPGYQLFQSESDGITKAYATAVQDWESTSSSVAASITQRELPGKPNV